MFHGVFHFLPGVVTSCVVVSVFSALVGRTVEKNHD